MFVLKFWDENNEILCVGGKHYHFFLSWGDAWMSANTLLFSAYLLGAIKMSIQEEFYEIIVEA